MFTTDIYLDRIALDQHLANAFGSAFGTSSQRVSVVQTDDVETVSAIWNEPENEILLRTSVQEGEFPLVIELSLRDSRPHDFVERLESAAQVLGLSILTDEQLANPLSDAEYLLVGADGRSELVFVDTEDWDSETPTFGLVPESQLVHKAHSANQLQRAD